MNNSMLNPDFSYVSFDFETTGLDTKKDEAIQIGIVKFDHKFTVLDTYSSLIKPNKPIKELKEIVRFVTGFSLEDLEHAPDIEAIMPRIQDFFDESTVIIGHNISFDLAILQKYRDRTPLAQLDTFILGKAFCHFKSSYALDVLHTEIKTDLSRVSTSVKYHDALADSYAAMELFQRCIQRITHLRHTYLLVDYVLQESTGVLKDIIKRTEKPYKFSEKKLFFPALKTAQKGNKKILTTDALSLDEHIGNKVYIGNYNLHILLKRIDRSKRKYILAFTHKSKQHIAQQHLQALGIHTHTLHDNVIFNSEQVDNFLQKKSFSDAEVLFVHKYYSHFEHGHRLMDVNTADDYMIFNALTSRKASQHTSIGVCTHLQLFQLAENITPEHTVLFFDHDRWWTNRSKRMKQPFDPLRWISFLEHATYKSHINKDSVKEAMYTTYTQQATIFIGVLSTEIDKLFINYHEQKREVDPLLENPRFPKTKQFFSELEHIHTQYIKYMQECSSSSDTSAHQGEKEKCEAYRQQLKEYLHDVCEIEKRMYNGNQRYYVLHQRNIYLGYDEFKEHLPPASYVFMSNSDTSYPSIGPGEQTSPKITLITQANPHKILSQITSHAPNSYQFIFSTSKQASQKLFNICIEKGLEKTYTIVAENITGGIGKNLYLAKYTKKPVLCIGGYNFYLEACAKKFDFAQVYLYHIYGNKKEQIIHDLLWYCR